MIYPSSEPSSSDVSLPVIGEFWRGKLSSVDGFFLGMPAVPSHKEHAEDNDEQKS